MSGFRLPRLTLFPGFAALEKENLDNIDVRSMPLVLRRIAFLALAHWGRLLVAAGCALGGRVFDLMQTLLLGMAVYQAAVILTLGPAHAAQAQADPAARRADGDRRDDRQRPPGHGQRL